MVHLPLRLCLATQGGLQAVNAPACVCLCVFMVLQCDIIIDESWEQSTGGLTQMSGQNPDGFLQKHGIEAYGSQIPAVTNKLVFTVAKTTGVPVTNPNSPYLGYIGLDWFERGVSRADWVSGGVLVGWSAGCCHGWTEVPPTNAHRHDF